MKTIIKILLIILWICIMFWLCNKKSGKTTKQIVSNIQITDVPDSVPEFRRAYKVTLSNNRNMVITIKDYGGALGTFNYGEIYQGDGRSITFDPDRVADKILDPELAPVVQQYCDSIKKIDAEWRKSKPSSFKDESGTIWTRTNKFYVGNIYSRVGYDRFGVYYSIK